MHERLHKQLGILLLLMTISYLIVRLYDTLYPPELSDSKKSLARLTSHNRQ